MQSSSLHVLLLWRFSQAPLLMLGVAVAVAAAAAVVSNTPHITPLAAARFSLPSSILIATIDEAHQGPQPQRPWSLIACQKTALPPW